MATNATYITGALQLLGVLSESESASAEQGSDGLTAFNDMMASLSADGISLGFAPQSSVSDDAGLNIEWTKAIKALLAVDLAPHYGRPVSPELAVQAVAGRNQLARAAINLEMDGQSLATLPLGYTVFVHTNIEQG